MTTGPEAEARLAGLADDVHRARAEEAKRRIRRHRATAAVVVLAVIALVTGIVLAIRGGGSGGDTGASAAPDPTTATTLAPSTTAPPDPRPTVAPPVGTTPDPTSLLVLVDRERNLPLGWEPVGLVAPQLQFVFEGPSPKRMMRPEAAAAVDRLGLAAARAGVPIIGVSAYRSAASQKDVYNSYVNHEGEAAASTFSAKPGHSEHQTGLAIDVTGADRTCPAEPCFAATPQAAWLAQHAPEFGFIVRYPKGKELVTGYTAEPWHLRYVGVPAAKAMAADHLTLEEYLRAA